MAKGRYNILYLSNRNTARSIFAEAIANGKGRGRFKGYSAGLNPASELDSVAVDILRLSDYPTEDLRPKHWREFAGEDAPAFDFVFTLCDLDDGEPPPIGPAAPSRRTGVIPSEKFSGEDWVKRKALSEILAGLERLFEAFAQLPFASLNEMSLRTQLDKLHRSQE